MSPAPSLPPTIEERSKVHPARSARSTVGSSELVIRDGYENVADVEVNNMFDSKKDLQTRLQMMKMRTNYQFKIHKSNTCFLVFSVCKIIVHREFEQCV